VYKTLRFGLPVAALGAVGVLVSHIRNLRVLLITSSVGIVGANAISTVAWVVLGVGLASTALGCIPVVRDALGSLADSKRSGVLAAADDPVIVRKELTRLAAKLEKTHPEASAGLGRCLAQMDSMDKWQAQLDEILRLTDTGESWGDVVGLLGSVERTICENMRVVILRGIAYDHTDLSGEEYAQIIAAQLRKNEALLGKCKETLAYVADLIGNNTGAEDMVELEAYLSVLRDMVNRNNPERKEEGQLP